ncbi:MAG TPA: type II toxin-antitoxin system HicB family antitoxin [Gemmataceae bacterium]
MSDSSHRRVRVLFSREQAGGYSAAVPALPGCVSQGETLDEARANIREAAEGWLEPAADWPAPEPLDGAAEAEALREVLECFVPSAVGEPIVEEMDL